MKPRIFLACSSETVDAGLLGDVAAALSRRFEVRRWNESVFRVGDVTIDRLREEIRASDFALVVLAGDDRGTVRGSRVQLPRDNAIFELGMAMQILGRKKGYAAIPKGVKSLRLPTDIAGVTLLAYDSSDRTSVKALAEAIWEEVCDLRGILHGGWHQAWDVDSTTYAASNPGRAYVVQYGDSFRARWTSKGSSSTRPSRFEAVGAVRGRHVTGTWAHMNVNPIYTGSFQLFIEGEGESMRGIWCGHSDHNRIKSDQWVWTRTAPS